MVFLESVYVHVLAQHFKVANFVGSFDFFQYADLDTPMTSPLTCSVTTPVADSVGQ
jgi:hypothetical protein